MIKKSLVTTALESTWPKEGPLIFLGSWCCSFSRREYWSSLDFEIVPYHWDDRDKLLRDYRDLELIYEAYLAIFAKKLNEIHRTELSNRFWRILIGPWLYTFIQVVFDRWYMLSRALEVHDSLQIKTLGNHFSALATHDMDSFNYAIETDEWNEALYGLLVEIFFSDKVSVTHVSEDNSQPKNSIQSTKTNALRSMLIRLSNSVSSLFTGNKDIFVIAPHMSFVRQIILHIKLRQFPVFWFRGSEDYSFKSTSPSRETVTLECTSGALPEFETVLSAITFKLIPKIYLEGFQSLLDATKLQGWPKTPKAIFTSNSYASNEIFKCWAGYQVDAGSKLIIGQHGGNFGMTPMAIHETHQIKISDKWLSWGPNDIDQPKIIPVGNFKSRSLKIKHRSKGDALLVSMTLPKFSYYLYSVPIAGQVGEYFNDQLEFAEALPDYIRQKLRVRLYPVDRDWDQRSRWQSRCEKISFDSGKRSLIDSLSHSRIFVGTYNATTYLETFSVNMPSILFWNPRHWEVNAETRFYFGRLIDVGILHTSPKSAAAHLVKIWNDIDAWWFSDQVQQVISDFNSRYSMNNPQAISSIAQHLKSL